MQTQTDQRLAQAESSDAIAAAAATAVPNPAYSAAYPAVAGAARDDPGAYAMAFAAELLDRDYARQSRTQLLAWAQAEEAPNTLPGVPSALAGKALVLSLVAPDLPGGSEPVPAALTDAVGRPCACARVAKRERSPSGGRPGLDRAGLLGLAARGPGDDHHGGHRHPHHRRGRPEHHPVVRVDRDARLCRGPARLRVGGSGRLDGELMACGITDPVGCVGDVFGGAGAFGGRLSLLGHRSRLRPSRRLRS